MTQLENLKFLLAREKYKIADIETKKKQLKIMFSVNKELLEESQVEDVENITEEEVFYIDLANLLKY